jgi:hypothetical protein
MSNAAVAGLCRLYCTGGRFGEFAGVFPADRLPLHLAARSRFLLVVNLGEIGHPSDPTPPPRGHFVTVAAGPSGVLYIDPYGLPCLQPRVNRFLRLCRRRVLANWRQVQDLRSVYCGMYAVLFAAYLDRKPNFKLRFHKAGRDLRRNDTLCARYLRRMGATAATTTTTAA